MATQSVSLSGMVLNEFDNGINGILLTGVFHCIGESLAVLI